MASASGTIAEESRRGDPRPRWRAGGVLVQYMPPAGGQTLADLPGDGDFGNAETADPDFVENDNWTRVKVLLRTLTDAELADPDLSAERVLFRLYHETGVRVFEPIALEERCTCSVERIEAMLRDNFSAEERQEMVVNGEIEVVCEFCSADYHFHLHEFDQTQH